MKCKKNKHHKKDDTRISRVLHLSGCHSPCLTLSITMSQSSQVSVSSASWSWMDICQLYSPDYFDVARCDLAHYHSRHESILCINILIIRFILITCTLPFAGPPVRSMLNLIQYCTAYILFQILCSCCWQLSFLYTSESIKFIFCSFFSAPGINYSLYSLIPS